MNRPFSPSAATVSINVGAASQAVMVSNQGGVMQVRVCNAGSAMAWLAFGGSGVSATTASGYPVPAGVVEVITLQAPYNNYLYIAALAAGASGSIYFTPGAGI